VYMRNVDIRNGSYSVITLQTIDLDSE